MADSEAIFKQFKEHSVAEFFKKNQQMLGFSGKVKSLTTVVHEFVTNSLDACEEAGILPEIEVKLEELGEEHYSLAVKDNGPGIPKTHIGKALGQMLAGTKFHRYVQQRGQQGIGASGCCMFSYLTTGKPTRAISCIKGTRYEIEVLIDFKTNKPLLNILKEEPCGEEHGLTVIAEYKEVKHEKSNKGIFEYLRRTALANPHAVMTFTDPLNERIVLPRSVEIIPAKPVEIQPHPLGISTHDLLELAHHNIEYARLSSFLQNSFSRFSAGKVSELREIVPDVDFNKKPSKLTWEESEKLVKAFGQVKWIAPATDSLVPIGKLQVETSFRNIFSPDELVVTERSPKVFRGGIPFMVETAIAYGGGVASAEKRGEIMRFANKVPLLFDTSGCGITEAVKSIDWTRYGLKDFDQEPLVVLVNLVSVHIPYTGAGKQAISSEEEVNEEIRFAVMEAARGIQKYICGKRRAHEIANKKKVVSRYVNQLSSDLADLAGKKRDAIQKNLTTIIEEKYAKSPGTDEEEEKENGSKEDAQDHEADESASSFRSPAGLQNPGLETQDSNGGD